MATISKQHTFSTGTTIVASEVNTNFDDLFTQINDEVVHIDGTNALTALLSGPSTDPTADNHLSRKAYVDAKAGGLVSRKTMHSSGSPVSMASGAVSGTWYDVFSSLDTSVSEVDGHTYMIVLQCPNVATNSANGRVGFEIRRAGTTIARQWSINENVDYALGINLTAFYTASATGSATYDIWGAHSNGSNDQIKYSADSSHPASLTVVDLGTGV